MSLRVLSHDTWSGSYESQLLNKIDKHDLQDILYDLIVIHTDFLANRRRLFAHLTKIGWCAVAYKISSLLDGNLVRKTAEICRRGYDMILRQGVIGDMDELNFIHGHLYEHYKYSRHPMPILNKTI